MKCLQPIKSLFLLFVFTVSFTSCTEDTAYSDASMSGISVQLKSTFSNYNKVYLDIQDIEVRVKENTNANDAWVSLDAINNGTHNICDYSTDDLLLLVDYFEIESTQIYEMRLVLGDTNFVDINNVLYSLDVTTLGNTYASNLIQMDLVANRFYDIVIDLDLDQSISYNEDQNIMVFNPKIYTAIKQIQL